MGTWTLQASDQVSLDTGTLNAWSIIVTPRNFMCTPFVPTAAFVSVRGRIFSPNGTGLGRQLVTITDSIGETRSVTTNSFGYFEFVNIRSGESYLFAVRSKEYNFTPQIVAVKDDITNLIFIADQ